MDIKYYENSVFLQKIQRYSWKKLILFYVVSLKSVTQKIKPQFTRVFLGIVLFSYSCCPSEVLPVDLAAQGGL